MQRRHFWIFVAAIFSFFTSLVAGASAQQSAGVQLMDVRIASAPERSRIVFDLSDMVQYSTFPVGAPDRLVIEFSGAQIAQGAPDQLDATGLIEKMSLGAIDAQRVRAVIFLNKPVAVSQLKLSPKEDELPARLVIELEPGSREIFDRAVEAATAQNTPNVVEAPQQIVAPEQDKSNENSNIGEVRPLVVIDPGHGGIDKGATGSNGRFEKDIVLEIAKKLRVKLNQLDRFDIALTRDSDVFLTLGERVQLARDNQANLFISLHADSFEDPFVRGGSVYTRDENATDVLDKVLAESENQADLVAGFNPPQGESQVVDILVDLMRRETRRQSFEVAQQMAGLLNKSIPMRANPLRRADFFVLQAPEVPSILIELGFLSNQQDLRNLSHEQWQDRVAETLARGIAKYFDVGVQP